jgi:hypothetical protein
MIPRRIHYFWAGSPIPAEVQDVMRSWKSFNPEYETVRWDDLSLPQTDQVAFLRRERKWSALSDFARVYSIYTQGGFYLDTDIRLIRSLDTLRAFPAFVCTQAFPVLLNNAASGGISGTKFFGAILQSWQNFDLPGWNNMPELLVGPWNVTRIFLEMFGFQELPPELADHVQVFGDLTVLPKRCFYPYNWNESFCEGCIHPKETFGIHLWKKRW